MTLYEEWQKLIDNQTEDSFEKFWDEYAGAEIKLYTELLEKGDKSLKGTLGELAQRFEIKPVFMMAFLDGISESLKKSISIEKMDMESKVALSVDFEALYLNMLKAEANHLYTIESWEKVLASEKREEIEKEFKKSKTYIKEKTPGRNDPCSCGSGKKYKKCCGRNN